VDGGRSPGTRHLLMQRDPPVSVVDPGRAMEFHLLERLAGTPLPAPEVHWLDDTGENLFRPTMVVTPYEGATGRAVLRSADPLGSARWAGWRWPATCATPWRTSSRWTR
jgi:aminoglycoside phosphotransferase (APT) family kinase protein